MSQKERDAFVVGWRECLDALADLDSHDHSSAEQRALRRYSDDTAAPPGDGTFKIRMFREDDGTGKFWWIAELVGQNIVSQGDTEWSALDELGRLIMAYAALAPRKEGEG